MTKLLRLFQLKPCLLNFFKKIIWKLIVIRTYIFRLYNQICALYGILRKALELRISKCTSESILYFNIVIINKFHISYPDMFVCYIGMERNSTVSDEIKKCGCWYFRVLANFAFLSLYFYPMAQPISMKI